MVMEEQRATLSEKKRESDSMQPNTEAKGSELRLEMQQWTKCRSVLALVSNSNSEINQTADIECS